MNQGHFSLVREIKSIGSNLKVDFAQFWILKMLSKKKKTTAMKREDTCNANYQLIVEKNKFLSATN